MLPFHHPIIFCEVGSKVSGRGQRDHLYKADLLQGQRSFQVAMKKFNIVGASVSAEADFLKEVHIALLASGTCQWAWCILGCCKIDGSPCLVMSLYASSAAKRLEVLQGPMAMSELTSMAVEILEGLVQLHGVNVWHLDLKPANILLDGYQHAYLADFGILHLCIANTAKLHSLDQLDGHSALHGSRTNR